MKRFHSILIALVVVLALNAQNIIPATEHFTPSTERFTPAPQFSSLASEAHKTDAASAKCSIRHLSANGDVMHKAEGDVIEITGDKAAYISYTKSSNDWFLELEGSNDDCFYLDYRSTDFAGVFTLDDCDDDYTFYRSGSNTYDHLTSLEVTVTGLSTAGYTIKGTAVGDSGTRYVIDIDNPDPLQPVRTVDVDGDVTQAVVMDDGVTTFVVKPATGEDVVYQIAYNGLIGSFKDGDILKESTLRQNLATGEVAQFDNGTMDVTLGDDYIVSARADLVMSDSVEYRINFSYQLQVVGQKDITVTNVKVDASNFDWSGVYYVQGYNDDYTIRATCQPESYQAIDQEFSSDEVSFTVTDNATNKSVESIILVSATQTIDDNSIPTIKAAFIGEDMVRYVVDMTYEMPDEKGVKELRFDDLEFGNVLADGGFQVMGYNKDFTQYLSLAFYAEQVAGEYSIEDETIDTEYSYFYYVSGDDFKGVSFLKGSATATMDESGAIIVTTHLFGDDGYWYDFTVTSQYAKAHKDSDCEDEDIDVHFDKEDCYYLAYETDGYGRVRLQNEGRQDTFDMQVWCDEDAVTTIPEGTYEVNDTQQKPSVQPGELEYYIVYPTFYGTLSDEGYVNTPIWFLCEGTVTVYNNDGELAFEVDGKNSYDRKMHVTYNMDSTGISTATAQKAAPVRKMLKDGKFVIVKGDRSYNVVGQEE